MLEERATEIVDARKKGKIKIGGVTQALARKEILKTLKVEEEQTISHNMKSW
jgi:hypothetical protein